MICPHKLNKLAIVEKEELRISSGKHFLPKFRPFIQRWYYTFLGIYCRFPELGNWYLRFTQIISLKPNALAVKVTEDWKRWETI